MRANHIKLQIEKLRVLEFLTESINIESSELTAEMLLKLKEQIEELLRTDF
jgi:hypothetical protein